MTLCISIHCLLNIIFLSGVLLHPKYENKFCINVKPKRPSLSFKVAEDINENIKWTWTDPIWTRQMSSYIYRTDWIRMSLCSKTNLCVCLKFSQEHTKDTSIDASIYQPIYQSYVYFHVHLFNTIVIPINHI